MSYNEGQGQWEAWMENAGLNGETQTEAIPTTPRPAGLGLACDAWQHTSNPADSFLRRCSQQATVRLTILTSTDCYDVKRCPACADELRRRAISGTIEILAESKL